MFPSVRSGFRKFSEQFEGLVPHMYLDVKGLVTVAVGNLIEPVEEAVKLPFRFKSKPGILATGSAATPEQIKAEWERLKANASLTHRVATAFEPLTDLELSDESINTLILDKLASHEDFLKRQPWAGGFDTWPADAQLGVLSMAWAMGPAGPGQFPHFRASCQRQDFATAAKECKMDETGNPGLAPRNRANFTLFSNAAIVLTGEPAGTYQRSVLYYPQALQKPST
jgi:hypothetical protein